MPSVVMDSGSCESGVVLLFMSDAVASWYLQRLEKGSSEDLFDTKCDEELNRFFDDERLAGRIRNDDLAIIRIEIKERSIS